MRKILIFIIVFSAFALKASAEETKKSFPVLIPALKVETSEEKLLKMLDTVMSTSLSNVVPGEKNGLMAILLSPKYTHKKNEEMFLFLRLMPVNERQTMVVNSIGPVEIEITDLRSSNKKISGKYSILKEALKHGRLKVDEDIFIVNRKGICSEVILIFTLRDFNIPPLAKGIYRVQLKYSNQLQDYNCWRGTVTSNPAIIDIID
ncbi:MAG: hypothetical protein PHF11_01060 [Candidatus Omnitrophica bacterium]|nr:hypothetical protein [Candidatus Omnitrophota bacterium]